MKFAVQPKKMLLSGSDLLSLSRSIRQMGDEVESIERNLRRLSELDECRYQLRRQKEAIERSTARTVALATSLRVIAEMYSQVEEQNVCAIEDAPPPYKGERKVRVYLGSAINERIQRILKR